MGLYRTFGMLSLLAAGLAAQAPPSQPAAARQPGLYATFKTSLGDFTARLYEKETPITVRNFVNLQLGRKKWQDPKNQQQWTARPLYNNTIFHRVIAGFMIQGGDPAGNGTGEVGFTIKDEFVPTLRFDKPGILGMANIGQPNTGAAQFFITVAAYPSLNNHHTVWGEVVEGYDLVDKISKVKRNAEDRPLTPVRLLTVTFAREGPAPENDVLKGGAPATKKSAPVQKKATPAPATKKKQ